MQTSYMMLLAYRMRQKPLLDFTK